MSRKYSVAASFSMIWLALHCLSHSVIASTTAFPTFGISYTTPPLATFELTDSPTHIGMYRFIASSPSAGAAILLEVAPAQGQTLDAISSEIAKQMGGAVAPDSVTIGGEKAKLLTAAVHAESFTSRATYVVVHQDRLYIASGFSTPSASVSKSLEELLASVKFVDVESPTRHTKEFFDGPFEVFGRFSMNGPKFLRRTDNTASLLHFEAHDFTNGSNPINIDIQRIAISPPIPFDDLRDNYSAGLQKSLNSADPLTWSALKEVPGLHVSKPIKTFKLPDGSERKTTQRFCILEIAPGDFVQILFSIADLSDADTRAYVNISNKMLATIKLLPTTQPTK
jgi:hypothetical protein